MLNQVVSKSLTRPAPWDVFSRKLGKCMPGEAFTAIVLLTLPERPQRRVRSSGLLPQAARSGCVAPVRRKQVPAVLPRRLPDLCGQLAARVTTSARGWRDA